MRVVTPNGHAAAVAEAEPPAVERADDLAVLDPTGTERSPRVRTEIGNDRHVVALAKHGHPRARRFDGSAASLGNLVNPAQVNPTRHQSFLIKQENQGRLAPDRLGAVGIEGSYFSRLTLQYTVEEAATRREWFHPMRDIYDPPPVPEIDWERPRPEPFFFSKGDKLCLATLCLLLLVAAVAIWPTEPMLAVIAAGAGALIVMESWLTALGSLHRCPPMTLKARWTIFLAALLPWIVGVSSAVIFMLCLFWASDHLI